MLHEKLLKTIQKYNLIQKQDKIVIGVSGGPDSMCLLDSLYCLKEKLDIDIVVAHVNHMIRKEAEEETAYVKSYCEEHAVPCFIKKAEVIALAKEQKLGTEEIGRKIRYEFFIEVAKKTGANKIATAHNANDNAETVFMNILRGSGISGLKGIEIKRSITTHSLIKQEEYTEFLQNKKYIEKLKSNENHKKRVNTKEKKEDKTLEIIRPLRECTRNEIEEYCKIKNLNPKIDSSNLENDYTRNKIRNIVIPYLQKEFNPNILEGLNRLSDLALEEEKYFLEIIKKEYENLKIEELERTKATEQTKKIKEIDIEIVKEAEYKKIEKNINQKIIILDLKKFNLLPKVIRSKLLLYTIYQTIGNVQGISKIHIEDVIKLCQNNIGNKYLTPNKKIKIFVKKGKIYFLSQ